MRAPLGEGVDNKIFIDDDKVEYDEEDKEEDDDEDEQKSSKRRAHGKNLNLYEKFQKNGSRSLQIEFDYSSNLYRAVGDNYQLFIMLISNEVDRHAPFHYRSWQEVLGDVKMFILTTLHHYFDLQQYHSTEYWDGIKLSIQADCANRYKD
ncbi:hypothetical protein R6Q57_009329 [Mikania cordata]